ncbi:MAG: VOC family protein [Myxococcota bacterium]|nr:VOC family protein [Myxococcota bacterium]
MAAKKVLKKVTQKLKSKAGAARAKVKAKTVSRRVSPVPKGLGTVTPNLVVSDAAGALEFYKRALGAREKSRTLGPDGRIWHAEFQIGDSVLYINDAMTGGRGPSTLAHPSPTGFMIYVKDCDALFNRAVAAGGKPSMPVADMFWGDRVGEVQDPYGNYWSIATRTKNLSPREMKQATDAFAKQMASLGAPPPPSSASSPLQAGPPGGAQA